jgi:hypothetical protein
MKSKSLIAGGLLVASLALTGNAATAGTLAAHRYAAPRLPVASYAAPRLPGGLDVGQIIQSMLGGVPVQYQGLIRNAMRTRPGRGYQDSSGWSPSTDTSSPAIDNSANDAAQAAESQAIQSMNDTNAMNASMAAAEAQNEAAQAAAIQTEINANN